MQFTTLYGRNQSWVWLASIIASLALTANAAHADSTLTLNDAIARSLLRNPDLYQYRFTEEALQAQRETSALRPALAVELEVENFAGSGSTKGFDSAETTVALSSVIELGGKPQARVSFAEARIDQSEWQQQMEVVQCIAMLAS